MLRGRLRVRGSCQGASKGCELHFIDLKALKYPSALIVIPHVAATLGTVISKA